LNHATGINDNGDITGCGTYQGVEHAFLLYKEPPLGTTTPTSDLNPSVTPRRLYLLNIFKPYAPTPSPTLTPTPAFPSPTPTYSAPTPTQRLTPTSTAPIFATCWVIPSLVPAWTDGTLTVFGQLTQGGTNIINKSLVAEWYDGHYHGYCTSAGGLISPSYCSGHYWPIPPLSTVKIRVGLSSQDGQRFTCETYYFTP
jgi:hypothetical protein